MAAYVDTECAQFENVNEMRNFPFSESASLVDRTGKELPACAVSDLHIVASVLDGEEDVVAKMSSMHVSEHMVSACFVVLARGTSRAASVTVSMDRFRPYYPYRLNPLGSSDGIGGVVSFGNIRAGNSPETYFLDGAVVHPCCVAVTRRPAVTAFVDKRSGERLSGNVGISFSGYVSASSDGGKFRLSLEKGADSELASECAKASGSEVCGATPIRSINGVRPDDDGNIVIWFH